MHIVLIEPEIPPNTGNIARLCAVTGSTLHLIEPLGFEITDKHLQRAGMDYWKHVRWHQWPNWQTFLQAQTQAQTQPQSQAQAKKEPGKLWFVECGGPSHYAEVAYGPNDYLVFGRESTGIPPQLLHDAPQQWLRIPMFHAGCRSLNLSSSTAIVLYEALRQQGFDAERLPE